VIKEIECNRKTTAIGDVTQHRIRILRNEFSRGPIGQSVKSVMN
jgi:hypothetical protein